MAYSIFSQNGKIQYDIKTYVLDTEADLESLPVSASMGSIAYIIESGNKYILNSSGQWVALQSAIPGSFI